MSDIPLPYGDGTAGPVEGEDTFDDIPTLSGLGFTREQSRALWSRLKDLPAEAGNYPGEEEMPF